MVQNATEGKEDMKRWYDVERSYFHSLRKVTKKCPRQSVPGKQKQFRRN